MGAAIGALIGRTQSCQTGACPLTANPRRGAIWGGFLGLMLAFSLTISSSQVAEVDKTNKAHDLVAVSAFVHVGSLDEFKQMVLDRPGKTVVDFYATWCPPCKVYSPILDTLANEKLPGVNFAKVDVDKAEDVAREYNIEAMPTTIIFEGGKEVRRMTGVQNADKLRGALGLSS